MPIGVGFWHRITASPAIHITALRSRLSSSPLSLALQEAIGNPAGDGAKGDPAPGSDVQWTALAPVLDHVARMRRNSADLATRFMRPGSNRQTVVTDRHSIGHHVKSFRPRRQISSLGPAAEAQALTLDLTPSIGSIRVARTRDGNTHSGPPF
jgi:hypothetical protein